MNDTDHSYLIIDQGGQSSRLLVFDSAGKQRLLLRQQVQTRHSGAGRVEQDPLELVNSIRKLLDELPAKLGVDFHRLKAVGLVTQRSSLVCWDRHSGEPLSPVISWQDTRAAGELAQLKLDDEAVADLTGLRPNAHYGASKMRWCLDNLPDVRQALADDRLACGPLASYLLFALTRERHFAVDPGNAQRTLLFNLGRRQWDQDLLGRFAIPEQILPSLQPCASHFGDLAIGDMALPVRLLNGDQNTAFFGGGALHEERLYINAGTGAFIAAPWPESRSAPAGLLKTLVFEDTEQRLFVAEGTVNGAASALEKMSVELGVADYQQALDQWCRSATDIPLFLNGVGGLGAPYWRSDFSSGFVNRDSRNPQAAMVAVLESIVFLLVVNLQRLQEAGGNFTEVFIGGGLSELQGFCQRLADLSALPVFSSSETEATARGAVYLLAGQPAGWPQPDVRYFTPEVNTELELRFKHWLRAMAEATAVRV
ncbi:MAG: glycerol kinase [Gammaproteobacteria bacterium]|nr:MAG: glycerol kinase [Gammaproteobacteria bacterium]